MTSTPNSYSFNTKATLEQPMYVCPLVFLSFYNNPNYVIFKWQSVDTFGDGDGVCMTEMTDGAGVGVDNQGISSKCQGN